jgi:hypothetical protein
MQFCKYLMQTCPSLAAALFVSSPLPVPVISGHWPVFQGLISRDTAGMVDGLLLQMTRSLLILRFDYRSWYIASFASIDEPEAKRYNLCNIRVYWMIFDIT